MGPRFIDLFLTMKRQTFIQFVQVCVSSILADNYPLQKSIPAKVTEFGMFENRGITGKVLMRFGKK